MISRNGKIRASRLKGYQFLRKETRNSVATIEEYVFTSPIIKLFARILRNILEDEFEGIEEPIAFSTGRSCVDHIFALRQILDKMKDKGETTELIFVDLEKAYDSVPRSLLWKVLKIANINLKLINIIKEIYYENSCAVKLGNKLPESFITSKSLLKGCCLSPTLFKIHIDVCLRVWAKKFHKMGLKLNDKYIYHLLVADDQVIIAEDEEYATYVPVS